MHRPFHKTGTFSATCLIVVTLGSVVAALYGPAAAENTTQRIQEKFPKIITGKVVGIQDGDTATVLNDNRRSYKIRLKGIDAPEKGQDYGKKSKKALSEKIFGKRVRVHWKTSDRYRRQLGHIFLDDRWINKEMIRDGWAWHYTQYSDDADLARAEVAARKARVGLWAQPNEAIAPWNYRRGIRQPTRRIAQGEKPKSSLAEKESEPEQAPAKGFWLNTSSNVRHNSRCKYFHNTKRGRACEANEGRGCGICGG